MIRWVNFQMMALTENRFHDLQEELGITRREAAGTLLLFWAESQNEFVWKGTKEEILKFVPFRGEQREVVFKAFVNNRYISKGSEDDQWIIRGNRKQIEAILENREIRREAGRKGGLKSGEKRKSLAKKANDFEANEAKRSKAKQNEPTSLHFTNKKEEEHTTLPEAASPPQSPPAPAPQFSDLPDYDTPVIPFRRTQKPYSKKKFKTGWGARNEAIEKHYKAQFAARYDGKTPIVNNHGRSVIRRLLHEMDDVDAINALISRYLAMDDQWFLTKMHDLLTLEQNLTKVSAGGGQFSKRRPVYTFEED